jgi:hypothetical protein
MMDLNESCAGLCSMSLRSWVVRYELTKLRVMERRRQSTKLEVTEWRKGRVCDGSCGCREGLKVVLDVSMEGRERVTMVLARPLR